MEILFLSCLRPCRFATISQLTINSYLQLSNLNSVSRLNCCWPSPAQSFLASVSSRSMTKIFVLCFEMGPPLRREMGRSFYVGATEVRVRVRVRVRVTLLLAVYRRSVRLGDKSLETHDQYFFQLNTCGHSPYVTSSLTGGWVCHLQLLPVLASAVILRSESRGTHDYILLSQIRDSPNLEGQIPVFIFYSNRVARLYPPGTGFPFRGLLRLAGLRWRYWTTSRKITLALTLS
jgi:hypothetical protein